jgi:conjugal transfer pilus assembly protein TraA
MTNFKKILVAAAATVASLPAFAAAPAAGDPFFEFYSAVDSWVGGALGTGLAITMLLMGGAIGVAKNSPMPALSGVAGAAFLHWGPDIILQIMTGGAVF